MRIDPKAPQVAPRDIAPAEWNLVILTCADNDLDEVEKANIKRIEQVGSLPGKMNVIVLADGATDDPAFGWSKRARLMLMQRDPNNEARLTSSEIAVDPASDLGKLLAAHGGEVNSGDGATLKALLDYVREHFPAEHLATCIKDHGHAQAGIGLDLDDGTGKAVRDFIKFSDGEFTKALAGSNTDIFIGDGCLVANEEVGLAALRAGIPYMVASEELMLVSSINFTRVLNSVSQEFAQNGKLSPERFADILVSHKPGVTADSDGSRTLSVTKLRVLPTLQERFQAFSDALLRAGGLNNNDDLRYTYERLALRMGFDYIDLGDFARTVAELFPDGELRASAKAVVDTLAAMCDPRHDGTTFYKRATGLTVYAPIGTQDPDYFVGNTPWSGQHWSDVIQTHEKPADPQFKRPAWAVPVRPPRDLWEERGGIDGEFPPPPT